MRDISAIKEQSSQKTGIDRVYARKEVSLSSIRKDSIKDDVQTQATINAVKLNASLKRAVSEKRAELETTTKAIESALQGASAESSRLVAEAIQKAKNITTQAILTKSQAEALGQLNQTKQKQLEALGVALSQKEKTLEQEKHTLDIEKRTVLDDKKVLDQDKQTVFAQKKQLSDLIINLLALFEVSVEKVILVQELENKVSGDVSQTLIKAGRMIERTTTLIKEIEVDKSLLQTRATELKEEEELLIDRQQMLLRSAAEVDNLRKKYGK